MKPGKAPSPGRGAKNVAHGASRGDRWSADGMNSPGGAEDSYAPAGLRASRRPFTHGWRRGLHSWRPCRGLAGRMRITALVLGIVGLAFLAAGCQVFGWASRAIP